MFTDRRGAPRPDLPSPSPAATGPARFLFDRDLAATEAAADRVVPQVEHEAAIATARAAAFQAGYEAGRGAATAQAAERTAAAAASLAAGVSGLVAGADRALARIEGEAVAVAMLAARKLAAHLVACQPTAEIEALLAGLLEPLRQQPRLVVHLGPDDADALRDRIATLAEGHGFSGRIVLAADPAAAAGDCRIAWADGDVVRSMARADSEIAAAVLARFPRGQATPDAKTEQSE